MLVPAKIGMENCHRECHCRDHGDQCSSRWLFTSRPCEYFLRGEEHGSGYGPIDQERDYPLPKRKLVPQTAPCSPPNRPCLPCCPEEHEDIGEGRRPMGARGGTTLGARLRTLRWRALLTSLFLFAFVLAAAGPAHAQDSEGADFWLAFPGNLPGSTELSLFITGDTATSGTVSIPGLAFSAPFGVTPGTVTTVALPQSAELQNSDTIESLGIHVAADAEVTV